MHGRAKDLTGRKFGRLTVLRATAERQDNRVVWACVCECGVATTARSSALISGQKRSCGCARQNDMGRQTIGATYGRLTIVAYAGKSHWRCLCACGNETTVMASNLRAGKVKSCGCYRDEVSRTHGLSNHPMYKRWHAMLERCSNPKNTNFKLYGGRGIRVCARWRDFANFYADVGDPPTGLSLDRIDVNKGYEPGNVRWATWSTQAKNKRSRKAVVIESLSIGELETILAAKRQAELGVFG